MCKIESNWLLADTDFVNLYSVAENYMFATKMGMPELTRNVAVSNFL